MCQVGVLNGGRSSSTMIALSKECKWVFNKACTMPWCHAVVHCEVKMSCFTDDRADCGITSPKQGVFLPR